MIFLPFDFERESIRMAVRSIQERKLRSVLTATGIVIGIAAIISLVSIGEGTNAYIQEQFEKLGGNKIIVSSFSFSRRGPLMGGERLTEKDVNIVKSVRGVDEAIPVLFKTLSVTYKDMTTTAYVIGVNSKEAEQLFKGSQMDIETGRWLRPGDKYSVAIGSIVANKLFGKELSIRDKITIRDKSFQVVGIMKEIGSSQDDSQIYMPLETMREITNEPDEITMIYVQAADTGVVEDVAERIQQKLDNKYGEDTFSVMSTATLASQISTITGTLSLILAGIAGIALIVAGIGIANTMYMSILERTKEIGIMKAIGATSEDVLKIFLTEAAIIGLIGGLGGVLLGAAISKVLGIILTQYGMVFKTAITPDLALMGLLFSVVAGVVSGFMPARKAANLNPIDALRYE